MAASAGVQIKGANALARAARNLEDGTADELKAAHLDGAQLVLHAALPLVPTRSGSLRSSLKSSATPRSGRVKAGKKLVPYAAPIHFGWGRRNIHPSLFLYNALDKRRDEVLERFLEGVTVLADRFVDDANKGSD